MALSFQDMNLRPELKTALAKMNFSEPTPIQAAAIPVALEGRDLVGCAQTGTGKTAAFGVPLVARVLENPRKAALVLAPTR
ncbi:MAG TPA: DEAD/DEAH box helicase, partial [Bdellovibrionales bacterium]|nr:DEAD/DEAH box helicase [Bdellovibrionales bacterium]